MTAEQPRVVVGEPEPAPGERPERGVQQRRSERFVVAGMRCGLGRVVDFSEHGMKVETCWPWRQGVMRTATLRAGRRRAAIKCRCVWRRREGILRWSCGVQFDDANRWRSQAALELAQRCRTRSV